MAEKCRTLIKASDIAGDELPEPLRSTHLLWMCDQIEQHAGSWPDTKLHRWIGFVQCAMIANRILDLRDAKAMFDSVKNQYMLTSEDQDLTDHLNPNSAFEIDVGGQG
jgi:hypothetical protein